MAEASTKFLNTTMTKTKYSNNNSDDDDDAKTLNEPRSN